MLDVCLLHWMLQIDGTTERGLLRRFAVEAYPSIFLVEGGSTRMFTGLRSVDQVPALLQCIGSVVCKAPLLGPDLHACMRLQLEEFARGGYRAVEPLPFYRSPTSSFGRLLSTLYTCAIRRL